jgi:RNA-directed DNA polymerase
MQLGLFDNLARIEPIALEDVFTAYEACRKNKRSTLSALQFEIDYEALLVELWRDITTHQYRPSSSDVFLLKRPVFREVFAAKFRDRIVHHLVVGKLEPLFEKIFIYDSYACRKNRGTLFGIHRIEKFIRQCSKNYQKDCYILKLDIQGFFMHISRSLLWQRLLPFIKENYHHPDQKALIELCRIIIENDPTERCHIKGNVLDWEFLPQDKSLFGVDKGLGLPIGNLSSQMFANFYMNPFDHFVKHDLGFKFYGRYVDDFMIVDQDKKKLQDSVAVLRSFLKKELFLDLHPKKIYFQHYSKGSSFLGAMIRPYHLLPGKRVIKGFKSCIRKYNSKESPGDRAEKDKKQFLSSINSYLGILRQYKSYKMRKHCLSQLQGP